MQRCGRWRLRASPNRPGDRYSPRHLADAATDGEELASTVRLARTGDRPAFETLYARFAPVVHGIAVAHCGPGLAEDVTQEVFVTVLQRLPLLRDDAAFPGWLCTAARNAAVDARRKNLRRSATAELPELAGVEPAPMTAAADQESSAQVLACVQQLPDAYRETLVLRLVEGLTGPEIAARTGLTPGSVRVNLTRGMAQLRPLLAKAGWP